MEKSEDIYVLRQKVTVEILKKMGDYIHYNHPDAIELLQFYGAVGVEK